MPYDPQLASRLRNALSHRDGLTEKKMFGGIGFLLHGNMCCGVHKDHLVLRLGVDQAESGMENKHAKPFDITGRAMKGWLMVAPEGLKKDVDLNRWVDHAVDFTSTLPRK